MASQPADQPRPEILIVDDDALNLDILEEILADKYTLRRAADGAAGVELARQFKPALVLLDIMMPKLDGYAACRQIKSDPSLPLTHVILVSAKASTAERVRGYDAGADDYLSKPFEEDELLAKVAVQVRLRTALVELGDARVRLAADNRRLVTDNTAQQHQLANARRALTDTRDLLIFALAKLADSRDPETGAHLERIQLYSRLLAEDLAQHGPYGDTIDAVFVEDLVRASPLHDIGKVGIPDAVLLKPDQLTDHEFTLMKEHTTIGAAALAEVSTHDPSGGFLRMAVQIARSHHERWDGSGYPDRLVGPAIPLAARIVAVADVFDALTSARVYKRAFAQQTARSMIVDQAGRHFDPATIDAFKRCYDALAAVRERVTAQDRKAA